MAAATAPCWVFTDGRAGNLRQARALAGALTSGAVREFELHARPPWRWLAPRRLPGSEFAWGPDFREALRDAPPLVVGCGRQAALATRMLRSRGSRAVQILDPRLPGRHWDAVVVPEHDRLRGDNVHTVLGSLNPIDDAWLREARGLWPALGQLPGPRVLLALGGPTRAVPLDALWWERVCLHLQSWQQRSAGSLLLTCSPRTPQWLADAARQAWPGWTGLRWYGSGDGENPYPGLLAWADVVVASPDSVNLVSEACATRVPVCVPGIAECTGRHRLFLERLRESGRIEPISDRMPDGAREPLRELQRVAAALQDTLGL